MGGLARRMQREAERKARKEAREREQWKAGRIEGEQAEVPADQARSVAAPSEAVESGTVMVPEPTLRRGQKRAGDPWSQELFGTGEDVAGMFKVHPKTIERWRRESGLPCRRVGGTIRYEISDVLRWASARKEGS
jgi:Helix-turn-helix domain